MKKTQLITIWLLPIILIGGMYNPLLGYLVLGMMLFLLILSFFKGRYWCWNLCPRGAFLDIVLSKVSRKEPVPKVFTKQWFRWIIFGVFVCFLVLQLSRTDGSLMAIGFVFVVMCLVSTIIAIILGILTKHRSWCVICPMGTLQDKIEKMNKRS